MSAVFIIGAVDLAALSLDQISALGALPRALVTPWLWVNLYVTWRKDDRSPILRQAIKTAKDFGIPQLPAGILEEPRQQVPQQLLQVTNRKVDGGTGMVKVLNGRYIERSSVKTV